MSTIITKGRVQFIFFFLFAFLYVMMFNLYWNYIGYSGSFRFAPGTFLVALLGYWVGGYFYLKYLKI